MLIRRPRILKWYSRTRVLLDLQGVQRARHLLLIVYFPKGRQILQLVFHHQRWRVTIPKIIPVIKGGPHALPTSPTPILQIMYLMMRLRVLYRLDLGLMNVIIDDVVDVVGHFLPTIHLYPIHLFRLAQYLQIYVLLLLLRVIGNLDLIHFLIRDAQLFLHPFFHNILFDMLINSR